MRLILILAATVALSACAPSPGLMAPPPTGAPSEQARQAVANFVEIVDNVEPVAERICAAQAPRLNCDFRILVDRDPRSGVNAFYTIAPSGQPLIIFTLGMIAVAQNTDELAFTLGHEAGHHIAEHLSQQEAQAEAGARVFGEMARRQGANARGISQAAQMGSLVASRQFSQGAELEADALGAWIAFSAGYDPIRGAAFFNRIPDPGGAFLSTHPPNRARMSIVRSTVAQLQRTGQPGI